VPDVDPMDEESADEQMNFGFVTGMAIVLRAFATELFLQAQNYSNQF